VYSKWRWHCMYLGYSKAQTCSHNHTSFGYKTCKAKIGQVDWSCSYEWRLAGNVYIYLDIFTFKSIAIFNLSRERFVEVAHTWHFIILGLWLWVKSYWMTIRIQLIVSCLTRTA